MLWQIVSESLYIPGTKLRLSFDEQLLKDELAIKGYMRESLSPSSALNSAIARHICLLPANTLGLRGNATKKCKRNNWGWVFRPDGSGKSLVLVFAVQQILAAEKMQGPSFYSAYWSMFGHQPEEPRINPFGDGGKNSFQRLWNVLQEELRNLLGVREHEITFSTGKGSNKYRNLPVSQALLNEHDLQLIKEQHLPQKVLNDDNDLYFRIRKLNLSKHGKRKVYTSSLKPSLLEQVRDYIENGPDQLELEARKATVATFKLVSEVMLHEESDFFDDSTFYPYLENVHQDVEEVLDKYFVSAACLRFEMSDHGIESCHPGSPIQKGKRIFLLVAREHSQELFSSQSDEDWLKELLRNSFTVAKTALSNKYVLFQSWPVPAELEGLVFSPSGNRHFEKLPIPRSKLEFEGGVCVNLSSRAYLIGHGPKALFMGNQRVERDTKCELDGDPMPLRGALRFLSLSLMPCRHRISILGAKIFIELVEKRVFELNPILIKQELCVIPASLHVSTSSTKKLKDDVPIHNLNELNDEFWFKNKMKKIRGYEAAAVNRDQRWTYVEKPIVQRALIKLSYCSLPVRFKRVIEEKMRRTSTVPMYFASKDRDARNGINGIIPRHA